MSISSCLCQAQADRFQHLDVRDGLVQNGVFGITQDSLGFMWFCTPEGLNRYDSRSFKVYKHDPANPGSISSDYTALALYDSHHTLWIGTSKGLNKYNPTSDSFQQLLHNPAVKSSLSGDQLFCIYEDRKGTIWVSTDKGLDRLVDRSTNRFEHCFSPKSGKKNIITSICEDQAGNLWLGTYDDGLIRLTIAHQPFQFKQFRHNKDVSASLSNDFITCLVKDYQDNIWIGTKNGDLDKYDPKQEAFVHFRGINSVGVSSTHNEINCMEADKTGNIWIGTVEGIIRLELPTSKVTHYQNDLDNPQSLNDNNVYSIFRNNQGLVWAGTYYAGIDVLDPNNAPFHVLKAGKSSKSLSSKFVSCLTEDPKRNLWIGADGQGLDYVDKQTGLTTHYQAGLGSIKGLPSNQIKDLYVDKAGYTWVAMRRGGLSRLDPTHRHWTSYHYSSDKNIDNVFNILEDSQHRFWCISARKLTLFNKETGTFELFKSTNNQTLLPDTSLAVLPVTTLLEDTHKNIWISGEEGMYLLRYKSAQIEWIRFKKSHQDGNEVYSIHEDSRRRIWISTYKGRLKKFDPIHNQFIDYSDVNGLAGSKILSIQSDSIGMLWLSTSNRLIRFDPEAKTSWYYTDSDGIPGSEFELNASYRGTDGKLYFGSNDGLVYFNPLAIQINNRPSTVVFTALEVDNKPIKVSDESNLLTSDIGLINQLTLNHQQNFFTITFAVLNYIKSDKNQYAYKLEGLDQDWHSIKTPSITYNNLPSGEYTLLVKGANNDGVWSTKPTQLRIVILPPLWRTWWAYCLYFLAFTAVLYFILRFFWLRNTFNREQELYQAKLEFFTNISHEIRTHLTLIIGPIDILLRTKKEDKDVQKQLVYAKNSSNSLLNLVTELMDFRKAEDKQMSLHVSQNNIISFIKNISIAFQHLSEKRNIKFSFISDKDAILVWFDSEQLSKVIYNLLSNAYKFISDGGEIKINVQEKIDFLEIKISDNGKGIPAENVKNLFTNYFQVYDYGVKNTGYGIGLALSRTITELHHGTLSVESKEAQNGKNGFTCFTIKLRKGHHHFTQDQLVTPMGPIVVPAFQEETAVIPSEIALEPEKSYTILLVEDNDELRGFVRNILSHQYHIIEAVDGQKGWETAVDQIPDMVISDIMMADLDGLELCRRLKADERTSHIPVILLTAKSASHHLIDGYEAGADSYITKPVSIQALELNVRNLFNARELIRQKYSQQITLEPQNVVINTVDKEFIQKIIQLTEECMSDPEFGVDMLTIKVGMSTPVLYKKLKALTNMSVNDFTKSIRMKKAAQLLQQGHLNVNEVAYLVGFDDRRYFSREFKKIFNQKPSEYAKTHHVVN